MNRESIGTVVLAGVCVIAVVFAAATISSPVRTTKGDLGTGHKGEGGAGNDPGGKGIDTNGDQAETTGFVELRKGEVLLNSPKVCVQSLTGPVAMLAIVAAFLAFAYFVKRRMDGVAAVGLSLTAAIPVFLVYVLLTNCGNDPKRSVGLPSQVVGGGSGTSGSVGLSDSPVAVDPTQLPIALYLVLGVVLVGVLAFALSDRGGFAAALDPIWSGGGDEAEESSNSPPPTAATTLGRVAGEAADRIEEGTDVENEVYRAWREMTDPLDVDRPHSSTPAEFATAATEAGVRRGDVDELTRLFEEVRYGGYDPDENRESRAVDALRRIEAQYTDVGDDGDEA